MIKKFTLKMAFIATIFGFVHSLSTMAQTAPVVGSVASVFGITRTSAYSGCVVTSDGGAAITEKGICVSTSANPTIADTKFLAYKISVPTYEPCVMSGLIANTKYYVRAYATNSIGTSYSPQVEFSTSKNDVEAVWTCSTDFIATIAGGITATDLNMDKLGTLWGFNQNSGGDGTVTIKFPDPTGFLKVPTAGQLTPAAFDANVYMPFSITATTDAFTINTLNLTAFGYKTGTLKMQIDYSLDNFATAGTNLDTYTVNDEVRTQATATSVGLLSANPGIITSMGKENISWTTNIKVNKGQTLSFRMYLFGKAGGTMLMKNLIVSGTTGKTTAVLPTISKDDNLVIINQTSNLRIVNASEFNRFDVYSINGMLIRTVQNSSSEIIMDISGLKSGIYIMKGYSAKGIKTGKFVR